MKTVTWHRNNPLEFTVVVTLIAVALLVFIVMFSQVYTNNKRHKELVKCVRQGYNAVIYDGEQGEYICYNKGVLM